MVGKVPDTSSKQQNLCAGCGPVPAPLIPVQLCDSRHRGQFSSPLYVAGAYQMRQMVLEINELSCFVDGNRSTDRGCITWGFLEVLGPRNIVRCLKEFKKCKNKVNEKKKKQLSQNRLCKGNYKRYQGFPGEIRQDHRITE